MTDLDVQECLRTGESQICEFKSNFNVETIETLVAFANSKGGKVLIGISNKAEILILNLFKIG